MKISVSNCGRMTCDAEMIGRTCPDGFVSWAVTVISRNADEQVDSAAGELAKACPTRGAAEWSRRCYFVKRYPSGRLATYFFA